MKCISFDAFQYLQACAKNSALIDLDKEATYQKRKEYENRLLIKWLKEAPAEAEAPAYVAYTFEARQGFNAYRAVSLTAMDKVTEETDKYLRIYGDCVSKTRCICFVGAKHDYK